MSFPSGGGERSCGKKNLKVWRNQVNCREKSQQPRKTGPTKIEGRKVGKLEYVNFFERRSYLKTIRTKTLQKPTQQESEKKKRKGRLKIRLLGHAV